MNFETKKGGGDSALKNVQFNFDLDFDHYFIKVKNSSFKWPIVIKQNFPRFFSLFGQKPWENLNFSKYF